MINSISITAASPEADAVRVLYEESFPEEERIPWHLLLTNWPDTTELLGYYEDEALIGMSFVFLFRDLCYFSYIAISPEFRNQGYGTQLLELIRNRYQPRRIFGDIEEVRKDAPNLEIKQRRRNIYLRNGFEPCNVFYSYFNVDYEMISLGGTVSVDEWQALAKAMWGNKLPSRLEIRT